MIRLRSHLSHWCAALAFWLHRDAAAAECSRQVSMGELKRWRKQGWRRAKRGFYNPDNR